MEVIQTGSIAKFAVDYKQLTKNQDFSNLPTNQLKQLFNIYGVYITDKSELEPLGNIKIEHECEGMIGGSFICEKPGIYYINATFSNMAILNSPKKIVATNYSSIEVLNSPTNIPFTNELFKFEIKTKEQVSVDHFKVTLEGYEFLLAQVESENSKLIGKVVFKHDGPYQMKVFYDDELCFIQRNIFIHPEIYIDGLDLKNNLIVGIENVATINKRPGLLIKSVELHSLNFTPIDYQIVEKSKTQIDVHFTIESVGRYTFEVLFESDGLQNNKTEYFDVIESFSNPYVFF